MADGGRPLPMDRFIPGPDNTRTLRNALGRFPTGVTVVTISTPDGPMGITVNSFASVSLEPPLLLWCPGKASSRYEAFAGADRFAIHVLGQDHLDLAMGFAKRPDAFEGIALDDCPNGVPLIADCLARFECETVQRHEAGDHSIVVGQVTQASLRDGEALVFSEGMFGRFVGAV
ncbi:MAG: flavin reductase family protein [Dinoroseobacter sp.]|nr:flavin reductase family protein [Dinoroseobacter sp.]